MSCHDAHQQSQLNSHRIGYVQCFTQLHGAQPLFKTWQLLRWSKYSPSFGTRRFITMFTKLTTEAYTKSVKFSPHPIFSFPFFHKSLQWFLTPQFQTKILYVFNISLMHATCSINLNSHWIGQFPTYWICVSVCLQYTAKNTILFFPLVVINHIPNLRVHITYGTDVYKW